MKHPLAVLGMRTIAMFALLGVVTAVVPVGAAERISLFSDAAMTDCSLDDTGPGFKLVYVGHESTSGTLASQFRVRTPDCWVGATFVSSTPAPGFSAVGDAPNDMAVSYGACWGGSFLVATISYYSPGEQTTCCWISLEKGPSAPLDGIVSVDCTFEPHVVTWSFPVLINENFSCRCSNSVRASTWGRIKALYSN
jgi:hypothetical protein